jgi:hypothetical protein
VHFLCDRPFRGYIIRLIRQLRASEYTALDRRSRFADEPRQFEQVLRCEKVAAGKGATVEPNYIVGSVTRQRLVETTEKNIRRVRRAMPELAEAL